jgi:hypothetical protein
LTEDDLRNFEAYLCDNPSAGDMIPGTGGLRKLRFGIPGTGKRGGARVVYVDFAFHEKIYLFNAYTKSRKIDLTSEEKANIRKAIKALGTELERKSKHERV